MARGRQMMAAAKSAIRPDMEGKKGEMWPLAKMDVGLARLQGC